MAAKSTFIPYSPGSPPGVDTASLSRATWDEFFRIAQTLIDMDRPASIAGSSPEPVTVGPTTQFDRLFDEADAIEYEHPAGQINQTTGIWTCPQEGLYLIMPVIEVPAFTTPASKLFTASLRWTIDYASGAPDKVATAQAGGDDRIPLRLQPVIMVPLSRGDRMWFDLDLTHETKTGTVTVVSVLNITRQSGTR
jgi:hypothetical protein